MPFLDIHKRIAMLVFFTVLPYLQAQQQHSKTFLDAYGNKVNIDVNTGMTVEDKSGNNPENVTPAQIQPVCQDVDKQTAPSPALTQFSILCEYWAELQPRTQIERVSFAELIARLLIVAPSGTDFARYRGLQISSDSTGVEFDSTIVPDDIGANVKCAIVAGDLSDRTVSIFKCTIMTLSLEEAKAVKDRLVSLLGNLNLTEDEVEEHGKSAQAHAENRCAPSGECEDQHTYATVKKNGKMLQIAADPDFTYSAVLSAATGHPTIGGVSPNSASVTVEVFSVALKNPTRAANRIPSAGSGHQ